MRLPRLLRRAFSAALPNPQRKPPVNAGRSADVDVEAASPALLHWGRHLDQNHGLTIGLLDQLVTETVGRGIVVEPMIRRPGAGADRPLWDEVNDQIHEAFARWARRVDVTGELSWGMACRRVARGKYRDGEVFVQHVNAGYPFGVGEVPYRIELVEAEVCPMELYDARRRIRAGIERSEWSTPIAYWFSLRHPGDDLRYTPARLSEFKRVPADRILHVKFARRWPQSRGVSIMHGAIETLDDLRDYERSERIAARVGATLTAYIRRAPDDPGTHQQQADGQRTFSLATGSVWDNLLPGEEVGTISPTRPNPELMPFRQAMLRVVSAATGARYSSLARDYSGRYAGQRQELVEAVNREEERTDELVTQFAAPVYERWIRTARLSGVLDIPASVSDAELVRADYYGPSVPWIDPLKEAQADKLQVEAGFVSREQVRRRRNPRSRAVREETTPSPPEPRRAAVTPNAWRAVGPREVTAS